MRETASLEQVTDLPTPWGAFFIVFAVGLVLALVLTPLAIGLGKRWDVVARPGGRRKHKGAIPRTGGIPIYLAFMGALVVSQFLVVNPHVVGVDAASPFVVLRFDPKEVIRVTGLFLGGTFMFAVSLWDDIHEMKPVPLYICHLIAGGIAVAFLIIIEYVNNPFSGLQTPEFPYVLTVAFTLFWIGMMTNTVNWLDGLDGLAGGVVALACVVLFLNAGVRLTPPQHSVALFPLALLGATLGFLPYNFTPAKIFLGGGAYFMGYMLGLLSIVGGAKVASVLLVLGLPLLDTVWQILNRVMQGRSPLEGDRGHFHFRLLDVGLSQQQIVLGYYGFCAIFGGLSLLIPSQLYKLVALLAMIALTITGFVWASYRSRSQQVEAET